MTPGIISNVLDNPIHAARNWPVEDWSCLLTFDKMSVRPNLLHKIKHGVVIGFSDCGSEGTTAVVNVAFVALLSELLQSWGMPVAFPVAKTAQREEKIKRLLLAL